MIVNKLRYWFRRAIASIAEGQGYTLVPSEMSIKPACSAHLDDDAKEYLTFENPRLVELVDKYAKLENDVKIPVVWNEDIIDAEALKYFRGENAYVWQNRAGNSEINYALEAYYIISKDRLGLLEKLDEDTAFGVNTFDIAGRMVSRDLLDSIMEISFLDRHLDLTSSSDTTILDIGAGYGRMAHRVCTAIPSLAHYYCVDAVPVSTFLCDYYLHHRGIEAKATAVPLYDIESLRGKSIDIAINIHSFSECSLTAIKWWCEFIADLGVKYFMVVPNAGQHGGEKLATTPGEHDFSEIIMAAGYELIVKEPKYDDPSVQRNGVFPTYYYLFKLK